MRAPVASCSSARRSILGPGLSCADGAGSGCAAAAAREGDTRGRTATRAPMWPASSRAWASRWAARKRRCMSSIACACVAWASASASRAATLCASKALSCTRPGMAASAGVAAATRSGCAIGRGRRSTGGSTGAGAMRSRPCALRSAEFSIADAARLRPRRSAPPADPDATRIRRRSARRPAARCASPGRRRTPRARYAARVCARWP